KTIATSRTAVNRLRQCYSAPGWAPLEVQLDATSRCSQAQRTRPLIEKATNGRPMSIKINGQGFVSKAENTAMVACSTNKKPNQQSSAIFNPATAVVALRREISQANV